MIIFRLSSAVRPLWPLKAIRPFMTNSPILVIGLRHVLHDECACAVFDLDFGGVRFVAIDSAVVAHRGH